MLSRFFNGTRPLKKDRDPSKNIATGYSSFGCEKAILKNIVYIGFE